MGIKLVISLIQLSISLAFLGIAIYLTIENRKTLKALRELANQPRPFTTPQEIIDYMNKASASMTVSGEKKCTKHLKSSS